jgi:hypothetical protein
MPRFGFTLAALLLAAAPLGCGGKVIKAQANPTEGAVITVDGEEKRQDRWVVEPGQHQVDAYWPDGTKIKELVEVRRDIVLVLNRDGRPGAVEGVDQSPEAEEEAPPGEADVPTEEKPDSQLNEEERFERAKSLFQAGQKAFELAEFDTAIENFKRAYSLMSESDSPQFEKILVQVTYNLAVVYERSYDVTPEIERLRKARVMFQNYDKSMSRSDPKWPGSAEQDELRTHVQELETRVKQIENE